MKKKPDEIRRVALVANPSKAACREAVRLTSRLIQATGREVWMDEPTASLACRPAHVAPHVVDLADRTDLLMVFGGDGTMLRVAREAAGSATPMLGINAGGLGFLTAVPLSQLQRALSEIWAGRYSIERRHLMSASGRARGRRIRQTALNDFVIGRGSHSRMVELEVSVDGEVLTRYRCDGVIVSSPTG
ncbi:MAG TPA: NAD(+)/NADH kinase, partial [Candidatus Paceibacterota bacterium]|nr:NAD(+)/NADH kinase [Candidatus Paceibacterota bacterium]